jgi:GNAT superfamily N-acetyltransferase
VASTPLLIREIRPGDKARWDVLWAGYLEFYECELPQEITELTWRRLVDPGFGLYGFVAADGDRLIGLVHYHFHLSTWSASSYCYLEDLFVDPSVRGKGTGRALIEAVYRAADEHGAEKVYWMTQGHNAQARKLYDKLARLTPFVQYSRERK